MADEGALKFRYNYATCLTGTIEEALEHTGKYGDPEQMIYYSGVKEFVDGIVVAHTGLLLDPYTDDALSLIHISLSALQHFATAYTAPAPPRPPCHKAGSSNRQESSPTGWDPGPGQRMWIGYAYLFIFKMCIELF